MVNKNSCVEFVLDGRHFALPLENVKEIISRPEITPLPMASRHVRGIINLRGDVIPVVDLAVRLGGADEKVDRAEILILVLDGLTAGVMVDSASQVAELDIGEIRDADESVGIDRSAVRGVVRNGERLVVFLDAAGVLSVDREMLRQIARVKKDDSMEEAASMDLLRVVTFDLGGDKYGFRLEEVREILRYQPPVSVPDAPPFVEGVLQIRGAILPVVNLRGRLGRGGVLDGERAKILVADYGDFRIGFVADGIREVLQVPMSEVSDPPAIIKGQSGNQSVSAIVHHDDEIVTILDKDGLVDRERLRDMASEGASDRKEEDLSEKYQTFVVFKVAGQPFGLPIKIIREINRVGNLSNVPGMPDFVEGALDLRGDVIPAVSLRKRLSMVDAGCGESEDGRILVVEMGDGLLGLMVDDVTGVMEIPLSHISEPPLSMKELGRARDFVSKVARSDVEGERMVLVLSTESLLSSEEAASARKAVVR